MIFVKWVWSSAKATPRSVSRYGLSFEHKIEQFFQRACSEADHMVGAAIIHINGTIDNRIRTGEHDVGHIATQFPQLLRLEDEGPGAPNDTRRVVEIQQTNADAIDVLFVIGVIEHQPAVFGFNGNTVATDSFL